MSHNKRKGRFTKMETQLNSYKFYPLTPVSSFKGKHHIPIHTHNNINTHSTEFCLTEKNIPKSKTNYKNKLYLSPQPKPFLHVPYIRNFNSNKKTPTPQQTIQPKKKIKSISPSDVSPRTVDTFFLAEKSPIFKKKPDNLDNRMNLIYSQTKEHFNEQLKKRYPAKAHLNKVAEGNILSQLNTIKKRVCFMKKVVDFSYPLLVMSNSIKDKERRKFKKHTIHMNDLLEVLEKKAEVEKENERYFTQPLQVKKFEM